MKVGAAAAALLLLAFLSACSLLPGGDGDETAEASDDTEFEVSEEGTFPTDEEFAAQKVEADAQAAAAKAEGASQTGDLAAQVAASQAKSVALQSRLDQLTAELVEAEFSLEEAVSSTLILLDEQFAESQLEKTLALSSTVAYYTREYVSLERARLAAFRFAREYPEIYGDDYVGIELAWELASEVETDDFYYIRLHYRPSGTFLGTPGIEEFIMDKEGNIEFRQILREPSDEPPPTEEVGGVLGGTVPTTTPTTTAAN